MNKATKRNWIILIVVLLVTAGVICVYNPILRDTGWVSLQTHKDYDIVQYDSHRRIVWATNNYEDHIIAVSVDLNGVPIDDMSVIDLPMDKKSLGLCVSDSVWVVTGDSVSQYMPDVGKWNELQLDFDYINSCKTLRDGSVLFFGNTGFAAKHHVSGLVSYIELLPDWKDVAQDDKGSLWLTTENEIYRQKPKSQSWELLLNAMGADKIYFTKETLWIINNQNMFYWTLADQAGPKELDGVEFNLPPTVYEGSNGQIWIVSQKGTWSFSNGTVEAVDMPSWVKHINIINDFDPRENILFLSTEDGPFSVKLEK